MNTQTASIEAATIAQSLHAARERMTVRLAYGIQGDNAERILVDSHGWIFVPDAGDWAPPAADVTVIPVGRVYATWSDVPFVWCGACPYFR